MFQTVGTSSSWRRKEQTARSRLQMKQLEHKRMQRFSQDSIGSQSYTHGLDCLKLNEYILSQGIRE